jgi:HD-like signal output (HDOD) protein
LDKFSNDDVKSLPQLCQAISYDQSLASCLIKIANTLPHISFNKVTTVSRAAIVLGAQTVKNICLTAKLLDAMVRSKHLSTAVYQHVIQLMASSFYAGILAKMLGADYSEQTQEELYLAAMLYRIGETAFWNCAGEQAEQLIQCIDLPTTEFNQQLKQRVGVNFHQLSLALAQEWKFPDLLLKALDQPECRTIEVQMVFLADKLSSYIAHPPNSIHSFNEVMSAIAELMNISEKQLRLRIERARQQAIELLISYGANALVKYIKPLPSLNDFNQHAEHYIPLNISRERQQLQALAELTHLAKSGKDINRLLKRCIESIVDTIQFERCCFFMLNKDKTQLTSRYCQQNQLILQPFSATVNIALSDNIFRLALANPQALLVNNYKEAKWRDYITREINDIIADGCFCLAAVTLDQRPFGVILAQNLTNSVHISQEDFESFSLFIDTLNLCLAKLNFD